MILLQIALLALLPLIALRSARGRDAGGTHNTGPLDIGVFFACVVAVYGVLPLAGILLAYQGLGSLADSRLGGALPDESAVITVGWMYVAFLAGFVLAFAGIGRRGQVPLETRLAAPSTRDVIVATAVFVAIHGGIAAIRLTYGIGGGEDYLDSYAVVRDQPLFVQQILGVLSASHLSAAILVIVAVIAWRPRWHGLTALFVLVLLADATFGGGSRRDAFLCALAYVVARSIYGPRLRPLAMAGLGVLGVLAFTLAGMLRQGIADREQALALGLLQDGEFAMFFGNALDLLDKAEYIRTPEVSAALYAVDLLRLVPRQVIGDFKVDPAILYASTLYPEFYESGGAFAFGAIAEATLGLGVPEAWVRGLLLGIAYALVRRLLDRQQVGLLRAFVYVWFVALAYEGLRDTTFTLFPRFVMQVLPLLIVVRVLGIRPSRQPPPQPVAASASSTSMPRSANQGT